MRLVILLIAAIMTACVGIAPDRTASQAVIGKRQAIEIAKREIDRRKLRLPEKFTVTAMEGFAFDEINPRRTIYVVTFFSADTEKRKEIYQVNINSRNGEVEEFSDTQAAIPAAR
jgi:hypothetical protein